MERPAGDALEWALALLRAPGERHALRERPLPGGMERLLGIAAGIESAASADAARPLGESESTLRDAARFFAREVLFFPQADAYRVLGLSRAATSDAIKTHHRLLLQWLHPDRARGEDDSVFSARVNSAWNHLRSEDRRRAYDQAQREQCPPEVFDSGGTMRRVPTWVPSSLDLAPPPERTGHRLALPVLLAACLVMAWLIARDDAGQRSDAWSPMEAKDEADGKTDVFAIRAPDHQLPKPTRQSAPVTFDTSNDHRRNSVALAASEPPSSIVPPLDDAEKRKEGADVLAKGNSAVARLPRAPVIAGRVGAGEARAASAATLLAPELPPLPAEQHIVLPADQGPTDRPISPVSVAGRTSGNHLDVMYNRIQLARQAVDQLSRYRHARNRPPPSIWNSPSIQVGADLLRNELQGQGRVTLLEPEWRVAEESAAMTARYRINGDDSWVGQVTADLVWREGRWLVIGLSMERLQ